LACYNENRHPFKSGGITMQHIIDIILEFLNTSMREPEPYASFSKGWFHYLALALFVIVTIIMTKSMKRMNPKQINRLLIGFSIVLLVFEAYKQIIFTYQANGDYQWYAFPFQFCSTPMYVALFAGFVKKGQLKDSLIAFLGTFGLFAGLAVMLYPETVFITTVGINIQTMVHHGGMAALGIALLVTQVKHAWSSMLKAIVVFCLLVTLAILMNTFFNTWIEDGTFNMFFINPRFENGIPILSIFQPLVSPFVFDIIYIVGFSMVASLMMGISLVMKVILPHQLKTILVNT
jgi:hypothetical protein